MTETRLARIIRVVFLLWLVASIALVVAMALTLRPLPDQSHGRAETGSCGLGDMKNEKCVAATALSQPIDVLATVVPPFRHLRPVSYFLVHAESFSVRGASLWRHDGHEESQVE